MALDKLTKVQSVGISSFIQVVGVVTATGGFVGDLTGNVTGNITGTTSNASGATGDFSIADKIVHTGDTNTALRFPAADTITAETGGSERFKVTDSLKEVKNGNLRITSTYIDFSGDVSTPTTAAAIFRPADNTLAFSTGNNERLRIASNGSVGINTTLTSGALTVNIAGDYKSVTQNVADEGLIFQSFTTASTGDVYPGISWTGNPTALGRARAAITAIAVNDNNGSDLVFLTRNQADGTELDVTDDEKVRITSAGLVRVPDNGKFTAGAGDDLQIYHNGSHSFVENSTGELLIRAKAGENSINCNPDGSIELFHDNSKKFETKSNGTQTTGRVYLNGTNGGLDYNNTAHTLEYLVNGSTHSELNTGAYVPQGTKNLGSNAKRWQTLYLSNGIDFASTSDASGMTSELLDDYEEGTWTPTITGLGNHNNNAGSTWGKYTKIGNRVFITWRYGWTSRTTTNGGVVFLESLPFGSANDSKADAVYIGGLEGVRSNTGREVYGGNVLQGSSRIQFRASGDNVSENSLFGSLSTSMSSGYVYGGANYIV